MNPDKLPDHPVFLRLSESDRDRIMKASELWEAPSGTILFHPGDSGDELILLLEGRLESDVGNGSMKRWLPGDLWGEDRLVKPHPLESSLAAAELSRWLCWPRETFLSLVSSSSSLMKSLYPVRDADGNLISGLAANLPVSTGSGRSHKRIRASMRPSLLGLFFTIPFSGLLYIVSLSSEILPEMLFLIAPALFLGWFIVFLLKRMTREYGVEADSVSSRTFDWGRFIVESRHVPIDKIQGVETGKNGILRRLMNIGTVIVKTSAIGGELIFRDVLKPEALRMKILANQKIVSERMKGREREAIRRTLEENGLGAAAARKIRDSGLKQNNGFTALDGIRFRKSPAVLSGRLVLPVLIALIPILGVDIFTGLLSIPGEYILASSILPILWALYRFEDWRNDIFQVTGGYAVDLYRKPLGLKESRRQVELVSVQNIRTEQKGLMPFLFRFGDVILVTAGGAADTVFQNVSRPWKVQKTLFRYREEELRRRDTALREQRKEDLTRFAEALDQIRGS